MWAFLNPVRTIWTGLAEILWPPRSTCLGCEGPLLTLALTVPAGLPICPDCWEALTDPGDGPRCPNCTRPVLQADGAPCPDCELHFPFGPVWSLGLLTGPLRELVHHLKYNGREWLGQPLGRQLGAQIAPLYDAVLPLPLHRSRERERGYNQAALLATGVGEVLGRPVLTGLLRRQRQTARQADLDRAERRANLAGAFSAPLQHPDLAGRSLLLIDDVLTTGATATAATEALLAAGARRVDLAVLAVSTGVVLAKK
ncbi:MAG TPA: double zinc ribbon domain-containing protein [Symbiobacteriaceae bacterium]|nr:double zinc ribbon domain-containing protein [Symbiobacteriaceae bacterium]